MGSGYDCCNPRCLHKPFPFIPPSFYSFSIFLFKLNNFFIILLSPLPQMWIFSVFKSLLETRTGKANLKMPSKLSQNSSTDLTTLVHQNTSQRTFMFKQKFELDIIAKTADMLFFWAVTLCCTMNWTLKVRTLNICIEYKVKN